CLLLIESFPITVIAPLGNLFPLNRLTIRGRINLSVHIPKIVNKYIKVHNIMISPIKLVLNRISVNET
ncbi:MAG: hypothetical protein ACFFAO_00435, partial [Candidatus Hermodarchaeota archaeon]